MPEVLANATEALITNWLVPEGASITAGDPIVEVETEKALVEVQAEFDGVLARYLAPVGAATAVGAPIAVLLQAGETGVDIDAFIASENLPTLVKSVLVAPDEPAIIVQAPVAAAPVTRSPHNADRLFVSPIARNLARANDIDPAQIQGTGPDGRIVRRDVEAAIANASSVQTARKSDAPVIARSPGGFTAIPHTPMRRAISRRLTESKSSVPHFYINAECNAEKLLAFRQQVIGWTGKKISVNDLIIKAVAGALVHVPEANVIWNDDEMIRFDDVAIAIAVATEKGLVTPVLQGVNHLDLQGIHALAGDMVARARAGRIKQNEIEGGSFSITNLGMFGIQSFSAIINPPQSAILAVGGAIEKAVIVDGEIVKARTISFTLSVDHRAIDGVLAAQLMTAFIERIESPISLLLT